MLLLPLTPPLIYLKLKKIKGPKTHSLSLSLHFHFHFHKHGKKRSIAGTAQHSTKPLLEEIPFNLRKNEKTEIALNFVLEILIKKIHLQIYMRNTSKI